jgi:hypothetical protein
LSATGTGVDVANWVIEDIKRQVRVCNAQFQSVSFRERPGASGERARVIRQTIKRRQGNI